MQKKQMISQKLIEGTQGCVLNLIVMRLSVLSLFLNHSLDDYQFPGARMLMNCWQLSNAKLMIVGVQIKHTAKTGD